LEELIKKQTPPPTPVDQANGLKGKLTKLLESAKKASLLYSRDLYDKLVKDWTAQDAEIAELLRKLDCAVPCWHCIIDCYICPLLNKLHYAEKWLYYDDAKVYTEAYDLYDEQYFRAKDVAAKKRRVDRIESVLTVWTAWENTVTPIEQRLADNRGLIDKINPLIGPQPGKTIYDVFFILVPRHLAIAPPRGSKWITRIDKRFTQFCECNQGKPDVCCGPDVGEWSLRQRLIRPQPYLIDPSEYFKVICCLVENRYVPAKEALSASELELAAIRERIAGYEQQLKEGKDGWDTALATAAKAAIPSVIDCCDYERHDSSAQKSSRAY
jgi:hypothetical protein